MQTTPAQRMTPRKTLERENLALRQRVAELEAALSGQTRLPSASATESHAHLTAALRESEKSLSRMFAITPVALAISNLPAGKLISFNQSFIDMVGYTQEEMLGRTIGEMNFYANPDQRDQIIEMLHTKGFVRSIDLTLRAKSGAHIEVLASFDTSVLENGEQVVLGTLIDMTQRNAAENNLRSAKQQLLESETHLRTILQTAPDGFWILDRCGRFLDANPAYLAMSGYSLAELQSRRITDLDIQESPAELEWRLAQIIHQGSSRYETRQRCKNGSELDIEISARYIEAGGGQVICFCRNVTERRRIEDALWQRAEELQRFMDAAPIAMWVTRDPECRVITGNQAAYEIYEAQDGSNVSLNPFESTPSQSAAKPRFFIAGRELSPAELPMQRAAAQKIIIHNAELELLLPSGRKITILGNISPLFNTDGQVRGVIAAYINITERKQAEEKMRSTLAEKEILLREVHHRVKNNLQSIIALMQLHSAQVQDDATRQFMKKLEGLARTMALVYEQLYQSENLAQVAMEPYLRQLTASAIEIFHTRPDIQVRCEMDPIFLSVETAMPCGLIVNELVTNTLKYAFPPGFDRQPAIAISLRRLGDTCQLSVRDNGIGLSRDPDWNDQSTLGLRLVYLWVTHQMGGKLEVERINGTAFIITFKD